MGQNDSFGKLDVFPMSMVPQYETMLKSVDLRQKDGGMMCRASPRLPRMDRCFSAWLLASCLNGFWSDLRATRALELGRCLLSGA